MVRTSANPPVYHVLGGDTAHVPFLITQAIPSKVALFPEAVQNPAGSHEKLTCMHDDLAEAYAVMAKLRRMGQEENIHITVAHDASMELLLPEGDIVSFEGTLAEVTAFKNRDQTRGY